MFKFFNKRIFACLSYNVYRKTWSFFDFLALIDCFFFAKFEISNPMVGCSQGALGVGAASWASKYEIPNLFS